MALAEKVVKDYLTRTPERYAARVRWLAAIYFTLDILSIVIIIAIVWRVQYFITLAQRSNIETLVFLIVFVLAVYYLATTFKGFLGAIRIIWLNLPKLRARDEESIDRIERKKQAALPKGIECKSAYFDLAVRLQNHHDQPIKWEIGDSAGKLGDLEVDGVEAKYYPLKAGMNSALFEFVGDRIEAALQKRDPEAVLQITEWSTIDEDKAAQYHSMVQAFTNLERALTDSKPEVKQIDPIWPTVELTQADIDDIGKSLRQLVPTLRNESLLPDVEYEVEWSVPILPEPLGFMRLTRRENRADPVVTMGCAMFITLGVLLVILFFIVWPPWLPSK
ncbi:MAG: hypothetical protein ABIQ44_11860 [Chloroflexia bacterium]